MTTQLTFTDLLIQSSQKRSFKPFSAVRLFHGPGEGTADTQMISVDKYGDHAWVTVEGDHLSPELRMEIQSACVKLKFKSASVIFRSQKGETKNAETLFGVTPEQFIVANCGLNFQIRFLNQKNPGLFLDMDFVRFWLLKFSKGKRVLNLFSYTGSLSCAAGRGGAKDVTSVDLSKPYTEWAKENWKLNNLPLEKGEFLFGDSLDWLNRFKKLRKTFDVIVCDPPSFSRTKDSTFSTSKDTKDLHERIFGVLAPNGTVITSINTETIGKNEFLKFVLKGAEATGRNVRVELDFGLPPEFPFRDPEDNYLKGAILKSPV